jgi:hypothetical protein
MSYFFNLLNTAGGGGEVVSTLRQLLYDQTGNFTNNIKVRIAWNGQDSTGKYAGVWSSSTSYTALDRVRYPAAASPWVFRVINSVSSGGNPPFTISADGSVTYNSDYAIEVGIEMLQDSGDGINFYLYQIGFNGDDFIRDRKYSRCTNATSRVTLVSKNMDNGFDIANSASTITMPSALGQTRSAVIQTGLPYSDKVNVGSCTDSITIPATTGALVYQNITFAPGVTIPVETTIKIENSASNFIVGVVCRRNNTTGLTYISYINPVGSGTFTSWTVYTGGFLSIHWTSDVAGSYFYLFIDTYNSVTGALDGTVVGYRGAASSRTNFQIKRGKQVPAVTSSQQDAIIPTTLSDPAGGQKYGYFFTGSMTGTSLSHLSLKRANGQSARYIFEDASIPEVVVDTYNATTITGQSSLVLDNVPFKYGLKFIVIYEASTNVASTNQTANVYFSTATANRKSNDNDVNIDVTTDTLGITVPGDSMGEYAYRLNAGVWDPDHNGDITNIGRSNRVFTVDNIVIPHDTIRGDLNPYMYKFQTFTEATLDQILSVVIPVSGTMATKTTKHTLNKRGVRPQISPLWLQSGTITTGYNGMLHLGEAFFQKVKTELGEYILRPADNTSANLTSSQQANKAYIFYSTSASTPQRDVAIVMEYDDPQQIFRKGEANSGTPFIQDFSGVNGAKFYPFAYSGYVFGINETWDIDYILYMGNFPNANSNL